jgi:hypothetical protein
MISVIGIKREVERETLGCSVSASRITGQEAGSSSIAAVTIRSS